MAVVAGIGWPRGYCPVRGDLGCLANLAKAAGYRADGLAGNLNVAPRLLRRVFKDAFGIALKTWLVQVRSVEVRRRLLGDESIEEIATSVGFSRSKERAREFGTIYGVTPTEFRVRERNAYQDKWQVGKSASRQVGWIVTARPGIFHRQGFRRFSSIIRVVPRTRGGRLNRE